MLESSFFILLGLELPIAYLYISKNIMNIVFCIKIIYMIGFVKDILSFYWVTLL